MPYLLDPRRTVTLNLQPADYEALTEDALSAGYATPGTYVTALVANRGDAPAPIKDQRSQERLDLVQQRHAWVVQQLEAAHKLLRQEGIPFTIAPLPEGEYLPRSRAAQQRALNRAVKDALAQAEDEHRALAARQARLAARKAKQAAEATPAGAPPGAVVAPAAAATSPPVGAPAAPATPNPVAPASAPTSTPPSRSRPLKRGELPRSS